jgi:N-acetylglucosaminyl-diphospho-decaprenol L-rhamnosyltransferase
MGALAVVIVNWNSGSLLSECLHSLPAAAPELPLRVVVVDNASADGSDQFEAPPGLALTLVRNGTNRGFGAACNQGAEACTEPLILFLNPDTRLYPGSLAPALAALDSSSNIGIVGAALEDEQGRVARSCARFPRAHHFLCHAIGLDRLWPRAGHFMAEWDHARTRCVDQVIGAFFLLRRTLFDSLGGFDERFFVYFEEVDLSLRARRAGWHSLFVAEARAFHKGGGTSDAVRAKRLLYSLRSRLLFSAKHHRWPERALLVGVTWGIEPLSRALLLAARGRWDDLGALMQAYRWLLQSNSQPEAVDPARRAA